MRRVSPPSSTTSKAAETGPASAVLVPAARSRRPETSGALTRRQIRGSGLLLSGRGLSMGLKFFAEVLVVRYLTTDDYGAWTYALSAVVFLRGFATLGLHRAVVRFLPIHMERGEADRFRGLLALVMGVMLLSGASVVGAFYAFPDTIARLAGAGPGQRLDLLFIVVLLVPLETMDDFLTGICAAFTSSRTIFVRRYLLSPGLRIATALLLVLLQANVTFLAYGYLVAGVVGIVYYARSVLGEMKVRGLLDRSLGVTPPVRQVFGYTLPVMVSDWCAILTLTMGPLLLGYHSDLSAVALFTVVVPLVTLIRLVSQTFVVLFEPAAARLHARGDLAGLGALYWQSGTWVAVLTFPAFALSFAAAEPLCTLLFGERYAAAAPILSVLAVGSFAESVLGFSAPTLRVVDKVGWLLLVNATAACLGIALSLFLIPRLGALGAAIGTGACWIAYATFTQIAVHRVAGVRGFERRYLGPYLAIAVSCLALGALRIARPHDVVTLCAAVALASTAVLSIARGSLSIGDTFPELARHPALRWLLG